jgi:quinol monooxygenase YgiN
MYIVLVHSRVLPEHLEKFKAATLRNASASRAEAGCVRFDVLQQTDDPTRFTFIEMFKSEADAAAHRKTPHFQAWLAEAAPLMAEERTRVLYQALSLTEK